MILHKLNLANYRAFEQIEIEFENDVTVIAGVNGVGKSAILDAISVLLSNVLPKFTAASPRWADSFSEDDVLAGKGALTVSAALEAGDSLCDVTVQRYTDVELQRVRGLMQEEARREAEVALAKKRRLKEKKGRRTSRPQKLPTLEQETWQILYEGKSEPNQPIAVLFTPTCQLIDRPAKLNALDLGDQSRAFYEALRPRTVALGDLMDWLDAQSKVEVIALAKNAGRPVAQRRILESLQSVIAEFMPYLKNLRVDSDGRLRLLLDKYGVAMPVGQLSDGERGILAVVLDIARRLTIANPSLANPLAEGRGIILIDEIELHLHPQWQRQVLRRLRKVFPMCQFVISTHSPQIIGQVSPDKLVLLYRDENTNRVCRKRVGQSFGMDSSWILQQIMDAPARDVDTAKKLRAIWDAIDNGDFSLAGKRVARLIKKVGDFPDLQEAKAVIDRVGLLAKQ